MLLTCVQAPDYLVSLAALKLHLRIEHTYDDDILDAIRTAVGTFLDGRDGYLNRAIMPQTWRLDMCRAPDEDELCLPLPKLQSVTAIEYYDENEALQTFSASQYLVHPQSDIGYIRLKANSSGWPGTYQRDDAFRVTFVAGYADEQSVPLPIVQAALLMCADLYANRGEEPSAPAVLSRAVKMLLAPYRIEAMCCDDD